mgnify:CR=1 FL=1
MRRGPVWCEPVQPSLFARRHIFRLPSFEPPPDDTEPAQSPPLRGYSDKDLSEQGSKWWRLPGLGTAPLWGWSGGRVYSTALMVLCLEVYFRYGKVLGAR